MNYYFHEDAASEFIRKILRDTTIVNRALSAPVREKDLTAIRRFFNKNGPLLTFTDSEGIVYY